MSNRIKQVVFVILALVVILVVAFTQYKSGNTASTAGQNTQAQVDQATIQRIQSLENEVKTNPKNIGALAELGQLYFQTGDIDKAQSAFSSASALNPSDPTLHNGLGIAYFWNGDTQKAIAEYKKAIELDANTPDAYYFLAVTLSHSQPADIPGAIENWGKVVKLEPNSDLGKQAQQYIDQYKGETSLPSTAPPFTQSKP